jgi:hypothetical protein
MQFEALSFGSPQITITRSQETPMQQAAYQRIATEEAFAPPDMLAEYRRLLARSDVDPGFQGLMGFYMSSSTAR